tara:strand:- start:2540 stop:2887 length:348 start_codon:yes stop_codon:yes gene_type:complete
MKKLFLKVLILFVSCFGFCYQVFSAEVLQVTSSSVLLIGDNNRTYTVKIACAEISPDLEEMSVNWLRKQLPRHTKVNLKPKGIDHGSIVARVIPFNSSIDITEKYISEGLAEAKC